MKTPESKKLMYFAAIYQAEEGGFWSHFVDFPATDQGDNLEDTILQSSIFLQFIVDEWAKMDKPLPSPSSLEEVKAKLDPDDGTPECIVPVFVYPPSPTVRVQLTAKSNQIAAIDGYARAHDLSRSELMVQASLQYIRENG